MVQFLNLEWDMIYSGVAIKLNNRVEKAAQFLSPICLWVGWMIL